MKVKCPKCRKQIEYDVKNQYRPFCSKRCKMVDLGAWIEGDYTISQGENSHSDLANLGDLGEIKKEP